MSTRSIAVAAAVTTIITLITTTGTVAVAAPQIPESDAAAPPTPATSEHGAQGGDVSGPRWFDAFAPDREHLAPCGSVPFNLEPLDGFRLVDMTGDGSADDRISIRQDGNQHLLHLERSTGERSEVEIPSLHGQTPEISYVVQLDGPIDAGRHPAPRADEVIVAWGTVHTADHAARFFELFGTDERGCLAAYSFTSAPQGLLFSYNDNGSAGFTCDVDGTLTRSRATPNRTGWSVHHQPLVRFGATTVFADAGIGLTIPGGGEPPLLKVDC